MAPGVVADEAAAIAVPVFVGAGERDVVPCLAGEARAYAASTDITLYQLGRSAHMHNFSPRRALLWRRLQAWFGESLSTSQEDQ
jgi:pimeloyl-ACP methyl ester carboxylesterase